MYIYYLEVTGRILKVLWSRAVISSRVKINVSYETIEIDETEDNKDVLQDVTRTFGAVDIGGNPKYFIENGELHVRENWVQHIEAYHR